MSTQRPRSAVPAEAPHGRVVLVFTDIEGSTPLWEQVPDAMRRALELHNHVLRKALAAHGGYEVKTEGDAFMVAFRDAAQAVDFCSKVQVDLLEVQWPEAVLVRPESGEVLDGEARLWRGLRVRMGIHAGSPDYATDTRTGLMDYHGPMVNRAARLASAAHGGQILISRGAWDELCDLGGAAQHAVHELNLGWHRFKGIEEPEFVRQLLPLPLAARRFPPLRTLEVRKTNLTGDPNRFVGRSADLDAIAARLASGHRLLTLLGPGGAGKTRLVRRFGWTHLGEYSPDGGGVWFCDLSGARDTLGVVSAVGAALGVPLARTAADSVTQLGHALEARGRLLLLLDNFEQVVATAAETVGVWLSMAPEAVFLVTSREPLSITGESRVPVDSLPESSGIELFIERARDVRADLVITEADQEVLGRLVRALDGLPLAIELAAARANILGPAAILERLSRRFELLRGNRGAGGDRHRTLRAALDWSWDLLGPWERQALAQCAVFAGPFTVESAEAVLDLEATDHDDVPWVLDLLTSLQEKSLLRAEVHANGETTFHLMESVLAYAATKLDHAEPVERRHAEHYVRWARTISDRLYGRQAQVRIRQLTQEQDNLLAVQRRFVARADGARLAIEAVLATHPLVALRGPFEVGLLRIDAVLSPAEALGDVALLAELLTARGQLGHQMGRSSAAEADLRRALALAGAPTRQRGLAARALGNVLLDGGRHDEALTLYEEALVLHQGDPWLVSLVWTNLGVLAQRQGRFAEATRLYEQALDAAQRAGDPRQEALTRINLGVLSVQQDDIAEAWRRVSPALDLLVAAGDRRGEALARNNTGSLAARRGDHARALELFTEALALFRELGSRAGQASAYNNLALLYSDVGRLDDAERAGLAALAIHRQLEDAGGQLLALVLLGAARFEQGRLVAAREVLEEAVQKTVGPQHARLSATGRLLLASTLCELGERSAADAMFGSVDAAASALADLGDAGRALFAVTRATGALRGQPSAAGPPEPMPVVPVPDPSLAQSEEHRLLLRALGRAASRADAVVSPDGAVVAPPRVTAARYQLGAVLGRGGFGTVYRAEMHGEAGFRKTVAVKVLNPRLAEREDLACRLRDEARLLGLLSHRAIVAVHGLEKVGGDWAIVMEHIDGVSLNKAFALGPVPPRVAVEILSELASALHTAWATRGPDGRALRLLHRDIKPGNVLVSRAGDVKLLDFGIARAEFESREALTRGGGMGTPGYIAPERFEGRDGPEADIYCLGVLLYEMLSAESFGPGSGNPERHGARVATAMARLGARGPKPPEAITALLVQMLACDPDARPSAAEIERACEAALCTLSGERLRGWAGRVVSVLGSGSAPASASHTTLAPEFGDD